MNDNNTPNELPGNDDDENLRMENELLRLKFIAEFGGDSHSTGNLDPALENQFLKQVMAFEQGYASAKRVKIFDLLGQPDFKQTGELSDEQVSIELEKIIDLLAEKNIDVNFSGTYDDRAKYSFITDELFEQEVDDFHLGGHDNLF